MHRSMSKLISVKLDADAEKALREMVNVAGINRNWLVNIIIKDYYAENRETFRDMKRRQLLLQL